MAWLTAHATTIFTVWALLWAFASALQSTFPAGSVPSKVCHVVLALSPLDVVKALKQVGVGLVPPLAVLCLFLAGCGGSRTPPQTPQRAAFDVVTAAADAWSLAAETCLDAAGAAKDGAVSNAPLAHECRVVLAPVHDYIIAAATAANIWDDVAQQNYACLMVNVSRGLTQAVAMFHLPQSVADAAIAAGQMGAGCHDAG